MKKLLIVGTGGHGKVVLDCAEASGRYSGISFLARDTGAERVAGYPVFYEQETPLSPLARGGFFDEFDEIIVAIGNNDIRLKKSLQFAESGYKLAILIHPSAVVSKFSEVREGTVIFAGAVVGPFSTVGTACIINTGAVVEHDCVLGGGVHVCPNATVAGSVLIGEKSMICAGSSIADHVKIGADSVIGAGAAVLRDVPDHVLAAGVPAAIKKTYIR